MARDIWKSKKQLNGRLKHMKVQLETYDPNILPNWATQFINASATARFAGGWDTEPLAQARKQIGAALDWTMKNLELWHFREDFGKGEETHREQ